MLALLVKNIIKIAEACNKPFVLVNIYLFARMYLLNYYMSCLINPVEKQ